MIHQHIFASPKPGMSEADFQRYWLEVHAIRYASKISQIKRYKVNTRIDWSGERSPPIWNGVAEIWLRNEADQLASMQSPEFIIGARQDEPKWAAFWNTQGLDTDTRTLFDQTDGADAAGLKMMVLFKRRPGLPLDEYRGGHLVLADSLDTVSSVIRCEINFTRDSGYVLGEPRFDAVAHYWFEDSAALEGSVSAARSRLLPDDGTLVDPRYVFRMVVQEHWIIGPEARA